MNKAYLEEKKVVKAGRAACAVAAHLNEGAENAVSRETLCRLTGMQDREVREVISKIRRYVPVLSFGNGYFIPAASEKHLINRWLEQEQSRAKSIFWSMRGARKAVKE